MKTRATPILLAVLLLTNAACAQSARNGLIGRNDSVVTNEQDLAAMAQLALHAASTNLHLTADQRTRIARAIDAPATTNIAAYAVAYEAAARGTNVSASVSAEAGARSTNVAAAVSAEAAARTTNVAAAVQAEAHARTTNVAASVRVSFDAEAGFRRDGDAASTNYTDSARAALAALIASEIQARTTNVAHAVAAEALARGTNVSAAVAQETQLRTAAILDAIASEAAARSTNVSASVSAAIAAEAGARTTNVSASVSAAVVAEAQARTTNVAAAVAGEAHARTTNTVQAIAAALAQNAAGDAYRLRTTLDSPTWLGGDLNVYTQTPPTLVTNIYTVEDTTFPGIALGENFVFSHAKNFTGQTLYIFNSLEGNGYILAYFGGTATWYLYDDALAFPPDTTVATDSEDAYGAESLKMSGTTADITLTHYDVAGAPGTTNVIDRVVLASESALRHTMTLNGVSVGNWTNSTITVGTNSVAFSDGQHVSLSTGGLINVSGWGVSAPACSNVATAAALSPLFPTTPVSTNVLLSTVRNCYALTLTNSARITLDGSAIASAAAGTNLFEAVLIVNVASWSATNSSFAGEYGASIDFGCTGCYRFAIATLCGTNFLITQTYPTPQTWQPGDMQASVSSTANQYGGYNVALIPYNMTNAYIMIKHPAPYSRVIMRLQLWASTAGANGTNCYLYAQTGSQGDYVHFATATNFVGTVCTGAASARYEPLVYLDACVPIGRGGASVRLDARRLNQVAAGDGGTLNIYFPYWRKANELEAKAFTFIR